MQLGEIRVPRYVQTPDAGITGRDVHPRVVVEGQVQLIQVRHRVQQVIDCKPRDPRVVQDEGSYGWQGEEAVVPAVASPDKRLFRLIGMSIGCIITAFSFTSRRR